MGESDMSKPKIAVIGAGSISEFHMKSFKNNPDAELAAVCDVNGERAALMAGKYGAERVFTSYRELLAEKDFDAVSITTWNSTHAEIAIAALEAGKHVLVEKPLCQTMEQALEIEETVRRTGKCLQVGFSRRFSENTTVLKRFVDAGDLGEIYYAKASFLRRKGNPGGWFADKKRSGGGPLIDLGVHVIDLCWYLMGKPKVRSVSGNTYQKLGNRSNIKNLSFYQAADYDVMKNDVEDMANALIRFENGASIYIDVSFTLHLAEDELSLKLFGDKGGAQLEPFLQVVSEKHDTILNMQPQVDHVRFHFESAFQHQIDHFVHCIRTGAKTESPVEDGVELMKMLTAVYESARLGKEVHF